MIKQLINCIPDNRVILSTKLLIDSPQLISGHNLDFGDDVICSTEVNTLLNSKLVFMWRFSSYLGFWHSTNQRASNGKLSVLKYFILKTITHKSMIPEHKGCLNHRVRSEDQTHLDKHSFVSLGNGVSQSYPKLIVFVTRSGR